jgi:hypothetical protein
LVILVGLPLVQAEPEAATEAGTIAEVVVEAGTRAGVGEAVVFAFITEAGYTGA